jgi:hypothetical protein
MFGRGVQRRSARALLILSLFAAFRVVFVRHGPSPRTRVRPDPYAAPVAGQVGRGLGSD